MGDVPLSLSKGQNKLKCKPRKKKMDGSFQFQICIYLQFYSNYKAMNGHFIFSASVIWPLDLDMDRSRHAETGGLEASLLQMINDHNQRSIQLREYTGIYVFVSLLKF